MKPEEKNRIVHEKIMGLCWHEKATKIHQPFCNECGANWVDFITTLNYGRPDYYHSIADAFKVIEKMRTYEEYIQIRFMRFLRAITDPEAQHSNLTWPLFVNSQNIVDAVLKAIGSKP